MSKRKRGKGSTIAERIAALDKDTDEKLKYLGTEQGAQRFEAFPAPQPTDSDQRPMPPPLRRSPDMSPPSFVDGLVRQIKRLLAGGRSHCYHDHYGPGDTRIWSCCRCPAKIVEHWGIVRETVKGHGPHHLVERWQYVEESRPESDICPEA